MSHNQLPVPQADRLRKPVFRSMKDKAAVMASAVNFAVNPDVNAMEAAAREQEEERSRPQSHPELPPTQSSDQLDR